MKIGYVVLHYVFDEITNACIDSICEHDPSAPILVIDNGSPIAYRSDVPGVRIANNQSLAAAMNIGTTEMLRRTAVDIVFQLNNDIILTGCTAPEIAWAFEDHAQVGIASLMMDQIDADFAYHPCAYEPGEEAERYLAESLPTCELLILPFVDNAAFAIRRQVWEQVGSLEERFTGASWGANYDYCWRARMAGWTTALVKSGFVFHKHRATWKQLDPNYFENSVQRMMVEARKVWGELAPKVLWRSEGWRREYLGEESDE